jgi:hypothetical protein
MKIRLADTIDASFEWEPTAEALNRAKGILGRDLSEGDALDATTLRNIIEQERAEDDKAYTALEAATEGRNRGLDMIWLARRSPGRVIYN